jgi:hypothetical protein
MELLKNFLKNEEVIKLKLINSKIKEAILAL